MLIVNGQVQEISTPINLAMYLKECNYSMDKIAVELNGRIIPKAKYNETLLNLNDKLEIVTFVGGG